MRRRHLVSLTTFAVLGSAGLAGTAAGQGDPEVIQKIIEEGTERSQVWDHLLYISEEIGPRLTGSSRLEEANRWTASRYEEWGLENVHLMEWGTIPVRFDRGPSHARMVEPVEQDFHFTAPSWSPGTDGPARGRVFKEPRTLEDLESIGEDLEGAWILTQGRQRGRRRGVVPPGDTPEIREEINERLKEAGIAGRIVANRDELVRTFGQRGWRDLNFGDLSVDVTVYIRRSDYDAMNSRLADGEEVVVDINLDHEFTEGPIPLYNTIAEIPGTDLADEVVIISAHLDSWDGPGSMGTQDNGTGSSVTLEAARILAAVGVKPRRTIRFIHWTGEEQGLLGSRAYAESLSETERSKISAVFVDDGGTNYQGGLECIEAMVPMLSEATAPVNETFPEMPVELIVRDSMPGGGASDHASFNRIDVPGFFWREDGRGGREGKNYRYVWHTQHDTPRYAVPEYLVQSATCSAVTAYNLAMADTLLPRGEDEPEIAETEEPERTIAAAAEDDFVAVDGPVSGTWNAVWKSENGERAFTLVLEMNAENNVRGRSESEMGRSRIENGTYNPETNEFKFDLITGGIGAIACTATVDGPTMEGSMAAGDFTLTFSAKKAASADAEPTDEDNR